jgi:transcriptional regulator with GAF, ATPase, and Fis domain
MFTDSWSDNESSSDRSAFNYRLKAGTEGKPASISGCFLDLTRQLQDKFEISRGLLLVREKGSTQFVAVSTWSKCKTRKNLTLRVPGVSSLFEKVAESGQVYSESFCDLFSGNSFERNLLLSPEAQSFVLQPLKFEGEVVGLIGYSSNSSCAFATFEEGLLTGIADQFAQLVVSQSPTRVSAR